MRETGPTSSSFPTHSQSRHGGDGGLWSACPRSCEWREEERGTASHQLSQSPRGTALKDPLKAACLKLVHNWALGSSPRWII